MIDLSHDYIQWLVDFDGFASKSHNTTIIDFDPCGAAGGYEPSATDVRELLHRGQRLIEEPISKLLCRKAQGHIALLRALAGQRASIDSYVEATMGCLPRRFDDRILQTILREIEATVTLVGVTGDEFLRSKHPVAEELFDGNQVAPRFRERFDVLRAAFATDFGLSPDFLLEIQRVEVDAYWTYWVDGAGGKYRLRLNRSNQEYTSSEVDQFVLHELVAHCCQMAAWQDVVKQGDLQAAEAITSVHTYEQPLLEGLAQALPLMMPSIEDPLVRGRALRELLRQMLLSNIYLAIESGQDPLAHMARYSDSLYIEDEERFLRNLFQYQNNPQLRAYKHAYPLGFAAIFERYIHGEQVISEFIRDAFSKPMYLSQEGKFETD